MNSLREGATQVVDIMSKPQAVFVQKKKGKEFLDFIEDTFSSIIGYSLSDIDIRVDMEDK
jgi:hypothetical protein